MTDRPTVSHFITLYLSFSSPFIIYNLTFYCSVNDHRDKFMHLKTSFLRRLLGVVEDRSHIFSTCSLTRTDFLKELFKCWKKSAQRACCDNVAWNRNRTVLTKYPHVAIIYYYHANLLSWDWIRTQSGQHSTTQSNA